MARIVPKLNLNKTPQLVDNNSLVFAKNIRLLKDGTIGPDTSLEEIETNTGDDVNAPVKYIAQIVGLNNKIYFFKESNYIKDSVEARQFIALEYPSEVFVGDPIGPGQTATFDVNTAGYVIRNGVLFQDSSIAKSLFPNFNDRVKIFEYDEVYNKFRIIKCSWKYSGGKKITGCVSVNGTGEYILTICEYDVPQGLLIPIKHINLNKCTESDDESFYTQAPNIPISNLKLSGRYIKNIPAGVYQFFIRYKIREHFYTNWFPCSKELFAGSRKITDTLQGSLKHTDLHEDSNNSFIFTVEHLYPEHCSNYEEFQLGFIISSDGGVFARSWKHFDMSLASSVSIYFDYDKTDIEEINIDDLLKVNYNIFNVNNIAQHKNKLYVSNYVETDFNDPDLQSYANQINISFDLYEINLTSGAYLNNVPLGGEVNGIYTSFGTQAISSIYGDSAYCNIETIKETISSEDVTINTQPASIPVTYTENVKPRLLKVSAVDSSNNTYDIQEYVPFVELANENYDTIIDSVIDTVKDSIVGVNTNGNFSININGTQIEIISFIVDFDSISAIKTEDTTMTYFGEVVPAIRYYRTVSHNQLKVAVAIKSSVITTSYVYNEYNTFLPFTKYDFYVHYVTQNGIVTNGYYIGTKEINRYCKQYKPVALNDVPAEVINAAINNLSTITTLYDISNIGDLSWYTPDLKEYAVYQDGSHNGQYFKLEEITDDRYIIVPQFDNIICPNGYVSCFISCTKYGNNVAQGYNYEHDFNSTNNKTTHKVDCLDLNCLLYNTSTNITIKNSQGVTLTNFANYYSSSTTNPLEYLGGSGHVEFTTEGDSEIDTKCWIIVDSTGKPYNKQLIKVTPFIKLNPIEAVNYTELINLNSPGYFCEVVTLSREYCYDPNGYYVSGSDVYTRDITGTTLNVDLVETALAYHNSNKAYIFSNYNLNYVSLTSDLTPIIRRYAIQNEGEDNETSEKQVITLVNSLLASYSLELKGFYKDYTRKLYQEYTTNKITKFDNTIRVSAVDVDELYRYIYRFEATDYYNVPTHRGVITNLVGIANTLYVHCEHSLFKFSDNKTLNAQEEEVILQENDIFNSGISEVFDAQYGYGGLKDKAQSLVTFNAYVFYDAVAKIIYAFGGEQQIGNISEPIQKIIDDLNPTDVQFVGDEINDRFFVNLRNDQGNVCLSFNFKSKSFISIHDIDFKFGFHSRRHTYFVHDNYSDETLIGWSIYRVTDKIIANNNSYFNAYQNCYTQSIISIQDMPLPIELNAASSCIDIIANVEYEKIKVLNYINWICSEILNYGHSLNFVAEEELNRLYDGDKLRVYSDSCATNLIELTDANGKAKLSKEYRNVDANSNINAVKESWQYPTYNCGVFSINYFRDVIQNGNVYTAPNSDLFKYTQAPNIGPNKLVDLTKYPQRQNLTQENSLIYGKYFVFRLIFNNRNFKIENVTFRMSDYGKTK